MSDLAPFVAAAISDKVVLEMMQELERKDKELQKLKHEKRRVAVTGHNGKPIYYQRKITDILHDDEGLFPCWYLYLRNESFNPANLLLSAVPDLEFHLGAANKVILNNSTYPIGQWKLSCFFHYSIWSDWLEHNSIAESERTEAFFALKNEDLGFQLHFAVTPFSPAESQLLLDRIPQDSVADWPTFRDHIQSVSECEKLVVNIGTLCIEKASVLGEAVSALL